MSKKTPEELAAAIKRYEMNRKPLSMRQTRLALLDAGLLSGVEAAIANMAEPEKSKAKIEWEYASTVNRHDPWLVRLRAELGLSEDQIDEIFYNAYQI